ncbi:uncharacterized protein GVI51_L10263 [Nakaseomyces glabratus]|uniref:DUF676 domain-containing protein n=2 Tax=Candida glabrata TaxID=5478 RepID=Q6FKM9_CANGA|nr:uncharacterized protein CAGL0L10318g [Nakaseomyces glabratus]KAH7594327.1 putative serine esterase (DUF676) [Nakaseomyces glabratus]KAH7601088.1 putative serine esterase (DUF676) [Nakaseomyces glabratus]KAI8393095.1 putative serine esterase (DUF676) [Nakaseomyces glabratus]KTB02450.1 putative lipase [Nakaseomyces glabratus]KTB02893.1 putative lipase [Nakaseomyces glabratus]|eukprot:XP_449215.1 uncharacterized protein CAGL0L10318g [[Candida] glabrata]
MGQDKHLFVLIHGLWGNYKHMKSLEKVLDATLNGKKSGKDKDYVFFLPKQNATFKTFDGIEIIGYRTLLELCEFMKEFKDGNITKISFVGYSLGGLVARFVVGKMYSECNDIFGNIERCIFMTMATPHLGIQFYNPLGYLHRKLLFSTFTGLGSTILGKSGRELFIANSSNDILVRLSEGKYIEALEEFNHRILFANVKNDRTVAFFTGFIADVDPFLESDNRIKFDFESKIPGKSYSRAKPRIVDLNKLDSNVKKEKTQHNPVKYWSRTLLLLVLVVFLIVPFAFFFNIGGTIYSYVATWRYRKMLKSNEFPKLIKEKAGFSDQLKGYMSDAYSNVMSTVIDDDSQIENEDTPKFVDEDSNSWTNLLSKYTHHGGTEEKWKNKFKKMPLTKERQLIMRNLNQLTWIKIPIYVKFLNSHGGIVARNGISESTAATSVGSVEFAGQLVSYLIHNANNK